MHEMASMHATFQHMATIVDSVIESRITDALAACTSMNDVLVVPTPFQQPPYDLVVVRAPGSLRKPAEGCVLIEHLSVTGNNDSIERPDRVGGATVLPIHDREVRDQPNWPAQAQVEEPHRGLTPGQH
jgi:hypothetical protein